MRLSALLLLIALAGCSAWDGRGSSLRDPVRPPDMSVEGLYNGGVDALQESRYARAAELFDLLEREHPYSTWALNAKLMGAYAEYRRGRYTEAIGALDRFIQLHPAHRDVAYAYYLRALSFYEQIPDPQRDQTPTREALAALQDVANRFPNTPYARDARLKVDLARDNLAAGEMSIGRWYQGQRLHAAAVGRFRRVVEEFQTTEHVAEALHRLTESHLALGLTAEARRTAAVLGHNYPGSPWFQDSYAMVEENRLSGASASASERGLLSRVVDPFGLF